MNTFIVKGKIDLTRPVRHHADGTIVCLYDHEARAKEVAEYERLNGTTCILCGEKKFTSECICELETDHQDYIRIKNN